MEHRRCYMVVKCSIDNVKTRSYIPIYFWDRL
jgi:hypothetical protein